MTRSVRLSVGLFVAHFRLDCFPNCLYLLYNSSQYVTNFKKKKEELAKRLYHLYNKEIFEGCLPADMEIR